MVLINHENNNIKLQNQLSPFVYWAQTENQITLKVDLKDVKNHEIDLKDGCIKFSANGTGAHGINNYRFSIDFYENIDVEASSCKVLDSKVDFTLKKVKSVWWPRITTQPQKPHWLKVDFDRWQSEETVTELDINRSIYDDFPDSYDHLHKYEMGFRKEKAKTVYLIFYNLFQFIGYLYILMVIGIRYYNAGTASIPLTYAAVGNAMKLCQLLQYLESMHPLFNYTKGSVLMPFLQVTGRNFVLFIMIENEEHMQTKPVIFYLFIVWSIVEIVRYPYYITTLIKLNVSVLTWLRYTIWIPLYPLGVLCEGVIILRNIPHFAETNRFTITMPNQLNQTFDMPTFLKIYLLILILPGTYFMMNHMSKTRMKKLGASLITSTLIINFKFGCIF